MFGNVKKNLPPRRQPPLAEHILEDILIANKDDIVFKLTTLAKDSSGDDGLHYPMNPNDIEVVYKRLSTYLSVKENLKELNDTLRTENQVLQASDSEMKKIAEEIKRQAQEALAKQ